MMISPWRSAKWPGRTTQSSPAARSVDQTNTHNAPTHSHVRNGVPTNPPEINSTMESRLGDEYLMAEYHSELPVSYPKSKSASPMPYMTASDAENVNPPSPNAVVTDAAMGTLIAVASKNTS